MDSNNITLIIANTINTIFSNLFSSIDNSIYGILDDITFINTEIINNSFLEKILGTSTSNGILLICNSLIIGFVLYYIISLLFSHITLSSTYSPLPFIFKLIIYTILMNFSLYICEYIIDINSNISIAIRQIGENLFNKNICFSGLIQELNSVITIENENFNIFSIDGLIKSFVTIGLFNLVLVYSFRYIMLKVLLLLCPFAVLTLINEKTSYFFKAWLKSFISLLFIQILISIILVLIFSLNLSSEDLFSKLLLIGSIYTLIKANNFVRELIGGISTDVGIGIRSLRNTIR